MRSLPISLKPTTLSIYEENSRQFLLYLQENSTPGLKPITFSVVEKYLDQASVRHSRSMDKVLRTVKLLLPILG